MRSYPQWPNLAAMMFARAREWPDRPMLRFHREDGWDGIRWGEFARRAAAAARALRAAGVSAGDRVLIVSENRPEYPIAETALMAIRAVPVPAYTTNTAADHAHLLRDSGASAVIVSGPALAGPLLEAARQVGPLDLLVTLRPCPLPEGSARRVLEWEALVREAGPPDDIAQEAAEIPPGALACLIYTSGTGGAPRGVMLPHRSILANCRGAFEILRPLKLERELYLSFLPLSHAYEHTVGQFYLLSIGSEIAYARGVDHLAADMLAVRPTIMTVVPRVLEVIRGRILAQVARQPAWQRRLFARAVAAGTRKAEGCATLADRLLDPAYERLVRRRVMARFGGRFRAAVSGGARLDPEVGRFYLGLGLVLMQGYGQTEAGPVISANPPDRIRIETVGVPLPGVHLRLAEDGEILVRGEMVMDGYWNKKDATAEVIRDGWLHTGDVGALDEEGYLRITDRKRDLIVLSGGENVSPARLEGQLMNEPEIAQAVVTGEGRAGLAALLVPADGNDPAHVAQAVAQAVGRVNHRLPPHERIRRHTLVPPFTLENGLLTPTQKIRRALVLRRHGAVLGAERG